MKLILLTVMSSLFLGCVTSYKVYVESLALQPKTKGTVFVSTTKKDLEIVKKRYKQYVEASLTMSGYTPVEDQKSAQFTAIFDYVTEFDKRPEYDRVFTISCYKTADLIGGSKSNVPIEIWTTRVSTNGKKDDTLKVFPIMTSLGIYFYGKDSGGKQRFVLQKPHEKVSESATVPYEP